MYSRGAGPPERHHTARRKQRPGDRALAVESLGEAAEQGGVARPRAAESAANADSTEATGAVYSCDSPRQVWIQAAEIRMSALRISPVRGSTLVGPTA